MSDQTYVILNESSSAPLALVISPLWLAAVAEACTTQLAHDVTPAWGAGTLKTVTVGDPAAIPPGAFVFVLKDDLPEAPGAIAYHATDGSGVPVAFLALNTCQTLDDVSAAISHEVVETWGDPGANRWADGGDGFEYALELCDAVEGNLYEITTSSGINVTVSDFVLPAFFDPGSAWPWDFAEATSGPFRTASGGYQIRRTSGTTETQVTGSMPARQLLHLAQGAGRPHRRLIGDDHG